MIAFIIKEIKGVTATESTNSSEHFKNFLLKLINYNDCDNTYLWIMHQSMLRGKLLSYVQKQIYE